MVLWYPGSLAPLYLGAGTLVQPGYQRVPPDATWRPLVRGCKSKPCKVSHHTGPHKTNKTHTRTMQGEQATTRHPEDLNPLHDMVRFSSFENLLPGGFLGEVLHASVTLSLMQLTAWRGEHLSYISKASE